MKKRIVSMFLICLMVVGLLPEALQAEAAKDKIHSKLTMELDQPIVGKKPEECTARMVYNAKQIEVVKVEWDGVFAKDGTFKSGEYYDAFITIRGVTPKSSTSSDNKFGKNVTVELRMDSCTKIGLTYTKANAIIAEWGEKELVLQPADYILAKEEVEFTSATVPVAGEKPVNKTNQVSILTKNSGLVIESVEWSGAGFHEKDGSFLGHENYDVKFVMKRADGKDMDLDGYMVSFQSDVKTSIRLYTVKNKSTQKVDTKRLGVTVHFKETLLEAPKKTDTGTTNTAKATPTPTPAVSPLEKAGYDINAFYTVEQADKLYWAKNKFSHNMDYDSYPQSTGTTLWSLWNNGFAKRVVGTEEQEEALTTVLFNHSEIDDLTWLFDYDCDNVEVIWIGPECNAVTLLRNLDNSLTLEPSDPKVDALVSNKRLGTYDKVIVIPEKTNVNLLKNLGLYCRIMTYSGDVYKAMEKGLDGAKEWCTKHNYTATIMAADRVQQYATCNQLAQYYYSCKNCGKPEMNDAHTFEMNNLKALNKQEYGDHMWESFVMNEDTYISADKDGKHVYWTSCSHCGITMEEYQVQWHKDIGLTFEVDVYTEQMLQKGRYWFNQNERWCFTASSAPAAFISSEDVAGDIAWAMEHGLVDTAVLGFDYTGEITRGQLASLAVKVAEKLTGKEIKAAKNTTFTDTKDSYVLKAHTAGIITDIKSGGKFKPTEKATKELAAAYFYQALEYVKKNSRILYTVYDSGLDGYTDAKELSDWAKTPMAFMEALDLVDGKDAKTLAPKDKVTLQDAIILAEECLTAHNRGWYQAVNDGRERGKLARDLDLVNCNYFSDTVIDGETHMEYNYTDRIWVTDLISATVKTRDYGVMAMDYLETPDPYNGQSLYVYAQNFKPIKDVSHVK